MLENIRIIMIETSHPGNIGSAARAMKTMGLSDLRLVKPQRFPASEANIMACHADDVLENAKVVETLDEALEGCHFVLGTSARKRYLDWPLHTPRNAAEKAAEFVNSDMQAAIVFGREKNGLINEELEKCHAHVHIPTNPDYQSLNLSQAVQILSYEMRLACTEAVPYKPKDKLATPLQMEGLFESMEKACLELGFLDPKAPRKVLPRLKRLFQRYECENIEANILRGIFEMVQTKCGSKDKTE